MSKHWRSAAPRPSTVFRSVALLCAAPGSASLFTATRSSTSGSFGAPVLLPGINDDTLNEAGGFSADGLTLYVSLSRDELELVFTSDRNSSTYRLHRSLRSCP